MNRTRLCLLLLAVVLASGYVNAQNEDELPIPIESDNQFPPDNHLENDGSIIEGSGAGVAEAPTSDITTELTMAPKLEEVESTATTHDEVVANNSEVSCPKPCVCRTEGDTNEFVVDCSGYGITEFPSPINTKTTKLYLQKNKITEIPKEVSLLKNLKELNANDNLIMELAPGSVSELPELVILKLANNRLIEYPKDLKNSLLLTKLQELDLGGNDMRTLLSPDIFTKFSSLRKITLATSTTEFVKDICARLKETLESVCTESCDKQSYDCPDAPEKIDDDMLNVATPGKIELRTTVQEEKEDADPSINIPVVVDTVEKITKDSQPTVTGEITKTETKDQASAANNFSLRTVVENAPADVASTNTVVKTSNETTTTDGDVKIGAKTADTTPGGVDKNIIAVIVAGMVVVVAVITIKKNWNSIKNRFSSTPRSPNERQGGNANGTSPEEVPLQDKAPV